eukprot:CAMPEP_0197591476 /NCGR_PEP_ID=MMETSP1326-20131121/13402_1 /TAXON_ID=1155430 /ORGANISM="Genus nov. species nov., Strain RCC2288" /LENGTH=36 /DNA_ID= /DNA_START= /DNA_END= /DNA_ORIENTATION=
MAAVACVTSFGGALGGSSRAGQQRQLQQRRAKAPSA